MLDKKSRSTRPDYVIIILVSFLLVVGMLMIYSASVVSSFNISKNPNFYFLRQVFNIFLGAIAFFITSKIHYSFWKKMAPLALVLGIILSLLVFIPGFSVYHGGAKRWIDLGPLSIQPSEFLKLGLILYFAAFFEKLGKNVATLKAFIPFLLVLMFSGAIVMAQPDMGTFLVLMGISTILFFVAGANLLHIGALFSAGVLGIFTLIKAAPYRMQRFLVFLDPSADKSGAGYQINQALIAIGSGGLFGLGFNQSRQKYQYLPEAQTDSIIAIMSEELGFVRMIAIIFLIGYLIIRGLNLSKNAPDVFSKLVIVGIISWVGLQAVLNISAMLSLVPLTGIPFPFISFGGSSIVVLLSAFGILINISKYCNGGKNQ